RQRAGAWERGPYEALLLLLLGAVVGARLLAALHCLGVERTAHDLVADAGKVLHTAATDEHDRVLLEVVALAGAVGAGLDAGRQAHTSDLAQRGVRLPGGLGVDARGGAAALG